MAINTQHSDEQVRQSVRRTYNRLASVTSDGDFAHVQLGCGHVTCKREGDRIILVAGPDCQLAASGALDMVTVAVSNKKDEVQASQPAGRSAKIAIRY